MNGWAVCPLIVLWFLSTGHFAYAVQDDGPARSPATPESRVNIFIRVGTTSYSRQGLRSGTDVLAPITIVVPMGMRPRVEPQSGKATLTAPGWVFRCRAGSRTAALNGHAIELRVAPRFIQRDLTRVGVSVRGPVQTHMLLVPVLTLAKLRGYRLEYHAKEGDLGPTYILTGPDYYIPLKDITRQEITASLAQRQADVEASCALQFGRHDGGPVLHVSVSIANRGKTTYHASDEFLFVEMGDGSVLAIDQISGSLTARTLDVPVARGSTGSVRGGPWLFRATYDVPIRNVVYADGLRMFVWHVASERSH